MFADGLLFSVKMTAFNNQDRTPPMPQRDCASIAIAWVGYVACPMRMPSTLTPLAGPGERDALQ